MNGALIGVPVIMEHVPAGIYIGGFEIPSVVITSWLLISILAIVCLVLTQNLQPEAKSKKQMFAEMLVMGLLNFFTSIFGSEKKARRFLPLLSGFFLYIFLCNVCGVVPGVGMVRGLQSPTTSVSVTLGLALVTFSSMIFFGIQSKKWGFFKEFIQPWPFLLPLNILDELVKPLSLTLRLYGSVFADEMILVTITQLFPYIAPVPFYFLALFFGTLQAGIFAILSAIYLSHAVSHE